VVFVLSFADGIISYVFGESWAKVASYTIILMPMFAVRGVVTALSLGFILDYKQKTEFIIQLLFLAMTGIAYYITRAYSLSIEDYLAIINWTFFSIYVVTLYVLRLSSKA